MRCGFGVCRTGYNCQEGIYSYISLANLCIGNKTRLYRYRPFVLPVRRYIYIYIYIYICIYIKEKVALEQATKGE